MTAILDQESLKYVTANGYSATDGSGWGNVFNIAWSNVSLAMTSDSSLLDPAAVHFVLDYEQDYTGATSLSDLMYGSYPNNVGQAFIASGKPLTDGLAPFFTSAWIRNNADRTAGDVYQLIQNTLTANLPPPAAAITALAGSSSKIDTYSGGNITSTTYWDPSTWAADPITKATPTLSDANKSLAQGLAQSYFKLALTNNLSIPSTLLDAYNQIDPGEATARIAELLNAGISGTSTTIHTMSSITNDPVCGDFSEPVTINPPYAQPDLLAAYKRLNATGPSTTDPGALFKPDLSFQNPPPTFTGWDYYATWALQRSAEQKKPLDANLLGQLDATNPIAGSYVRFEALSKQASTGVLDPSLLATLQVNQPDAALQVCKSACTALINSGQNLNDSYMQFIAGKDPTTAQMLCTQSLQTDLQPVNRLVPAAGLGANADHVTNTGTPTVHVVLTGMGGTLPMIGDIVELRSSTSLLGTSQPLTALDIAQGYVDVPVTTSLPDGVTNLYTDFYHTTTSTPSSALTVVADGSTSFNLPLGGGTSSRPPAIGDVITIYDGNSQLGIPYPLTQQDIASNSITVTVPSAWISASTHSVTFTNTYRVQSPTSVALPVTVNTTTPIANGPALPAARPMDSVAMKWLQTLVPAVAASWLAKFVANGFGTTSGSTSTGSTQDPTTAFGNSLPTALQGAVARVTTLDLEIKTYFDDIKQKTSVLNEVNQLMAVCNTGLGGLPLNTQPTDKLSDKLTPTQFNTLLTQFNALATDLKLGITISSATTKSDLDGYNQEFKTESDGLGNTNQLGLITVQDLTNQKGVMVNLISTLMNSSYDSLMKIISKM